MPTFNLTITRTEEFAIKADCAEDAVDIAFDETWTIVRPIDNKAVLEHRSTTLGHTVEEKMV